MKNISIGDTVGYNNRTNGYISGVVTIVDGNMIWATFRGPEENTTWLDISKITTVIKKNEWKGDKKHVNSTQLQSR